MRVLGIDPGTAACGFGIIDQQGGRMEALLWDWWKTTPDQRLEQRLTVIFNGVCDLIAEYTPDVCVLEESYVGADPRTALSVGQARGAILVACGTLGVPCREYAPAAVKQAVCGYGKAEKSQVQRMVKTILHLAEMPQPNHAADALAVAICHALTPPLLRAVG